MLTLWSRRSQACFTRLNVVHFSKSAGNAVGRCHWRRRDSNPQPGGYKPPGLTTALRRTEGVAPLSGEKFRIHPMSLGPLEMAAGRDPAGAVRDASRNPTCMWPKTTGRAVNPAPLLNSGSGPEIWRERERKRDIPGPRVTNAARRTRRSGRTWSREPGEMHAASPAILRLVDFDTAESHRPISPVVTVLEWRPPAGRQGLLRVADWPKGRACLAHRKSVFTHPPKSMTGLPEKHLIKTSCDHDWSLHASIGRAKEKV